MSLKYSNLRFATLDTRYYTIKCEIGHGRELFLNSDLPFWKPLTDESTNSSRLLGLTN